jgi:hypothetical protein
MYLFLIFNIRYYYYNNNKNKKFSIQINKIKTNIMKFIIVYFYYNNTKTN